MLLRLGQSCLVVSHDPWVSGNVAYLSAAGIALAAALRLAPLHPGDCQLTGVCIDMMDLEGIWLSGIFSALNR